MKSKIVLFSLFFLTVIITIGVLITGSSAATETSAQLPLSCYDSVTLTSRPVNPNEGCAISDDVIECPASAPNVYFGHKDYVNGNIVSKDNIQTMLCLPDNAPELIDPVKCKKPNGMIYYSDLLCGAYIGPNNTTIYPEAIQCQKGYELQNGGCNMPSLSPSSFSRSMPRCDWNTQYIRQSDNTCQSYNECTDTANPEYNSSTCRGVRWMKLGPSTRPSPSPSSKSMPQCNRKTQYLSTLSFTCQPKSNCKDAANREYKTKICRAIRRMKLSPSPSPSFSLVPSPSPSPSPGPGPTKLTKKPDPEKGVTEPTQLPEGQKTTETIRETITTPPPPPPPPTIITETIRETIEIRSPISVVLPTTVTEDTCKEYKTAIHEQVDRGNAFIAAADELIKGAALKNPEFKKIFYATLKESARNSRKLEKIVKGAECNKETLNEVQTAAKNFATDHLDKINQGLVFVDKDVKVQNRYVGIQEDMKWLEKFAKSVKGNPQKEKIFGEDLEALEAIRADFNELTQVDTEEKIFPFEFEDLQKQIEKIRENIEKNPETKKETTLKKAGSGSKKSLKQSSKAKKTSKKSSKKKKSTKKKDS